MSGYREQELLGGRGPGGVSGSVEPREQGGACSAREASSDSAVPAEERPLLASSVVGPTATPALRAATAGQSVARSATVIGREHVRLGRNNQDGHCVVSAGEVAVAVVTDGCSSQPLSEVGARLGARFLASHVAEAAQAGRLSSSLVQSATEALVGWLYSTARGLDARPNSFSATVADHFLFTFLCAVHQGDQALVFGLGDGVLMVDGDVVALDAGPENAPPYAAYKLLGGPLSPQLHFTGRARSLVVATDGLTDWARRSPAGLSALVAEAAVGRNPMHLQRRLNVLAEAERFSDDATLALLLAPEVP